MRLGRIARLALAPFEWWSHFLYSLIHTAVLRCPDHKVRLLPSALQKERVDITIAISHMHPYLLLRVGRRADGLHRSFPYLRLALAFDPLTVPFPFGSGLAYKRLLMCNPQQLS